MFKYCLFVIIICLSDYIAHQSSVRLCWQITEAAALLNELCSNTVTAKIRKALLLKDDF